MFSILNMQHFMHMFNYQGRKIDQFKFVKSFYKKEFRCKNNYSFLKMGTQNFFDKFKEQLDLFFQELIFNSTPGVYTNLKNRLNKY